MEVTVRVPVAHLGRDRPGLILGRQARTLRDDPDEEFPSRLALPFLLVR